MTRIVNPNLTCSHCKNQVYEDDEFCPDCGSLFEDKVYCRIHPDESAKAACIICCEPYCAACGDWINDIFLCQDHATYEIYEGMVRVVGTSDENHAEYILNCLEQAELHPFRFVRKASPISVGGPNFTLFRASGEYDGHLINEIKIMVPAQEVFRAEAVLRRLELLE